jgi:hypothetical protein
VHSSIQNRALKRLAALLCACSFGLAAAGCHNNNLDSGAGVAWTTLTVSDDAGQFTGYVVNIDSISLVGNVNGTVGAIAAPETVDLTKLTNLSELWATATLPVDTYTAAIITLDYTSAQVSVMVNGAPVLATLVDPSGVAPTTVVVTVDLDSSNLLTLLPTFATSNALRLAVNFDLSASNTIDFTTSPPTVTVKPFMSVSTTASDSKLIRVRGALINSSFGIDTYTVVVRPFFDEVDSLGTMTMFNDANTVYTVDGTTSVGPAGLTQMSQTSVDTTMSAAFTTFEPTATPVAGVTAGIFHSVYVVAGGTLEDLFTVGIEGDVIARSGDVLTLRGSMLFDTASLIEQYLDLDSQVVVGPATQVTADGIATSAPLDISAISVGQHITARGLLSVSPTNASSIFVDATGTSADTGSVRLQSTQLFGSLISQGAGSLALNLQSIENWPASVYNFAGNGVSAAQDSSAANYVVNTGALTLPVAAAGDPLWIDGLTSPFASAPPDFNATAVNAEPTVPATLVVAWTGTGTAAPFATLTSSGLTIDLANAAFGTGLLRIGAENIDITTLSGTPSIVPASATQVNGLPLFTPLFSVGPGVSAEATTSPILSFNGFAAFVGVLNTTFAATTPATRFVARGLYNRAANTFTASTIDVVL